MCDMVLSLSPIGGVLQPSYAAEIPMFIDEDHMLLSLASSSESV